MWMVMALEKGASNRCIFLSICFCRQPESYSAEKGRSYPNDLLVGREPSGSSHLRFQMLHEPVIVFTIKRFEEFLYDFVSIVRASQI